MSASVNTKSAAAALLPGVPAIESPFFAQLFAGAEPQLQQIARQLNESGYAVLRFPDAELDAKAEVIQQQLAAQIPETDWAEFRAGCRGGSSMRFIDAWKDNATVKDLACNQTIINLLSALYGRQAWPFQTLNFPVGSEQHVHTDSVHFSSMPERFMCGVWVALEDITMENGPLLYYPGSHKLPIYSNEHIGYDCASQRELPDQQIYHELWRALIQQHDLKPAYFTAKKGDAVIWAANLLHGGSPHHDNQRTRWSQVTHYFFDDCIYYTPMESDTPVGRLAWRELTDIQSGELRQNCYLGQALAPRYLAATKREHDWYAEFDPELYLLLHPDVAAVGTNPYEHYIKHGQFENRQLRFDAEAYLQLHTDVAASGMDAFAHYLQFGRSEGRRLK